MCGEVVMVVSIDGREVSRLVGDGGVVGCGVG